MKGKKLLAAILAALMTASSASIAALAENEAPANAEQVFDNSEESVKEGSKIALFGAGVASEDVTFEVGVGKTYETLAAAMEAAATKESVIFDIYGKVVLSDSGWLLDKLTDTISVKFAGKDEDAEIDLTAETAIFGSNKTALVNVSFENLKLSHSNYAYASDYGHATNYFTTWLRGAGKDGTVTYTDCVFTNGSSNNQYGKTTYTDCTFSHTDNQYGLWIYYAENDSETTVKVDNSSFSGYKGVKLYSESKNGTGKTIIENTTFTDITNKPAVVCSVAGTVEINNVTTTNCTYGLLASELAEDRNTTFANIMVDGNKPEYAVEYATLRTSSLDYAHEEGITDEQIAEYEAMYGWYDADAAEYTLSTVNEYIGFVNIINGKATGIAQSYFRGKTVKLASDLDFQGVDFLKADADGNAISDLRATWFYGTFDGDNHTMKNINYTIVGTTSSWGIGIFRNAAGATFKNVTVDGITVESNARISFGGLVSSASGKISNIGNSFDNCHIKNIDVDVNTTNGYNGNGGGLTGYLIDGSSIKNCSVEKFDFKASNGIIAFGGLCGYFIIDGAQQRIGEVTDCTVSDFKLEAKKVGGRFGGASGNFGGVGGLLGYGHDGNSMGLPIKNCHVTGLDMTIEGGENEAYVGGFIGMTRRTYSVEDSSVKGKITASNAESNDRFYVGGFVGGAPGSDVNTTQSTSYTNCTANVDITVTGKTTAGGFAGISGNARLEGVQNWAYNAGRNAVYTNCTAKGTISSEAIAGGFAGIADRGTYTDCSASETTVTGSTAGGFIGSIERVGNGSGTGYEVTLSDCSGSTGVKFFGSASDIVTINGGVAIVNGSDIYFDFAEAIKNANDGDTVKLLSNASGDGVVIEKNITIDLGGKTYTVSGKAVGSPGYETSAFQLLADNVTIKNGTLTTAKAVTCHNNERDNYTEKANMLIQNYSSLTLDGVTLDGTNLRDTGYTLSNNKGDVEIKDSTINTNGKTFAFDIDNSRGTNQTVTVTNSTINGFVEISGNNDKEAKLLSGTNEYKEEGTYVQVGNEFIKAGKRSIEVSSDKTEVEMGDEVKISVTLKGDDITNLVYALAYDPTKFEFISATTGTAASNGSISEMLYKEDGSCYDNEAVIAEYTFKALST